MLKLDDAFSYFHCCGWKQHLARSKMQEHATIDCAREKLRFLPDRRMTEAQKQVLEYLAAIGRRGGLVSRRELTKSHARQMVAIREMKRAAIKASVR